VKRLVQHGITPIYEKAFGYISDIPILLDCRSRAYQKFDFTSDRIPISYIQGEPAVRGARFAGVHVYGVQVHAPSKVDITDIISRGRCHGKIIDSHGVKQAFFMGLIGWEKGTTNPVDTKTAIQGIFTELNLSLHNAGFGLTNLVRTWFYLKDILPVYEIFNTVRNESYAEKINDWCVPASTGIQGESATGREISLDAIAIRSTNDNWPKIRVMTSPKQPEAKTYGALFSRGMEIAWPQYKILHISGTASIDEAGRSGYTEDPEMQIRNTLSNVSRLLKKYHATMDDVIHACAFFKRQDLEPAFDKILKQNNWHKMPCLRLCADICRDDLFFEMDCIAVVQ
jgi:enamine deaminase RidA (YjgF/YER057c/UK114 family)